MTKAKTKPKKPGRPKLPDSVRSKVVSTSLDGPAREFCEQLGGGSVGRGIREAVKIAMKTADS